MAQIRKIKNKKGISYKVDIRRKGYKRILKTFDKKDDAELFAKKVEVQMKEGVFKDAKDVSLENGKKLLLMKDLLEHFESDIAPHRYTDAEKYSTMYKWWTAQIGEIKIVELNAAQISAAKRILMTEKIKKKTGEKVRANNTINKYLMALSAVLTYAVKELEIINSNPMSKVSIMPKTNGRTRFLSLEEIELFLIACKQHSDTMFVFVLIAISTGGRYSEVLHLRVRDIDFQNNQLFFLDTKNKEHRGVPINTILAEVLYEYINSNNIEDYIFMNDKTGKLYYVRQTLGDIIKNIGLKDFHIHDLRHTTASYIAMNGGSLLDIAEILGHKSLVMARRYSHLTQKHTASVLNKIANKILPDF